MNLAITVVATVLAGIAAAVLHELTHYAVARVGGRSAWIEWVELNCYHEMPLPGPTVLDYLVGVAPFIVGGVAGVVWLAFGQAVTIPLGIAWGVYTLNGIPNDFRIEPLDPSDIY